MRASTKLGALVAVAATTAGLLAGPAAAAHSAYSYSGYSGGTQVRALGSSVTSDLTAASNLNGNTVPNSTSNTAASAVVPRLLSVGAITSDVSADAVSDGTKLISHVRTAGVSLLSGLIRADAVDTTAAAQRTGAGNEGGGDTTFVNLKIAGAHLPVHISHNFTVTIPGIATVILNGSGLTSDSSTVTAGAYAIYVRLLAARPLAGIGSTIVVNPAYAHLADPNAAAPTTVGGFAYGSHVIAAVGTTLGVEAGRTAQTTVPSSGTGGATTTNSTASVVLPGIIRSGTVKTTGTSNIDGGIAFSDTTSEVDSLNLFNGLIRADAIKSEARVDRDPTHYTPSQSLTFVNLRIGGSLIPVNVSPNTEIDVAGLGKVVVNEQTTIANASLIRGVHIILNTARAGLPVGAEVEIAVAAAWVLR